mgnify:CR=1 FL=1
MKINKGFTLIELVISMLVVAVAMLGFAALMAYSSRSIHSGYTKSAGTNAIQGVMRVLQSNREMLKEINFGTKNVVTLKDTDISKLPDGVAKEMVDEAFTRAANIPGVSLGTNNRNCSLLEIQITRTPIKEGFNDLVTFQVEAHFLYRPLATQSQNNKGDVGCILTGGGALMDNLCPFVNNAETKKTADARIARIARINNGLVCDILRTTL